MKKLITENKWLFIPFSIAIIVGLILLIILDKGEGVLLANGQNNPFWDNFMKYYTHTGDGLFYTAVIILLLLYRVRLGVTALVSFGVASGGAQLLKNFVFTNHYRPKAFFEDDSVLHYVDGVKVNILNSFPSGHTTTAFAMFTLFALLTKHNGLKAMFVLMAMLTGLSRMYLAQHFLEDVVAGAALGTVVTAIVYYYFVAKEKPLLEAKWLEYSIINK